MSNNDTESVLIGRRDFLKSAASIAGVVALGVEIPKSASAAGTTTPLAHTSIVYWMGTKFVTPTALTTADTALSANGTRVVIHGHYSPAGQQSQAIVAVNAHYVLPHGPVGATTPFYAWAASTDPTRRAVFTMPVAPKDGLRFSVKRSSGSDDNYLLSLDTSVHAHRLKAGTYAIALGGQTWTNYKLIENDGVMRIVRAGSGSTALPNFEYILITILGV